MEQPKYFKQKDYEHLVCKPHILIYDLTQCSRNWYHNFHGFLVENVFLIMDEDHCVYIKRSWLYFVFMTLYVDDIIIAENILKFHIQIKVWLSSLFEMSYMDEVAYILGIQILRDQRRRQLWFLQESYIKIVLKKVQHECLQIERNLIVHWLTSQHGYVYVS